MKLRHPSPSAKSVVGFFLPHRETVRWQKRWHRTRFRTLWRRASAAGSVLRVWYCFGKKLENLQAAFAVFAAYYNYCWRTRRPGKSGKRRPTAAMMAGLADHTRSFDELFAALAVGNGDYLNMPNQTPADALAAWLKMVAMIAIPVILLLVIISVVACAGRSSRNRREND